MTMTRSNSIMLVGLGAVLLIAAHGVVVWGGVSLSTKTGGWLPWIGGGALAFAVYHVIQALGAYHVVRHIRGRDHSGPHRSSGHKDGRGEVEHGPHDKHKQPRSVPRNATVKIETVRPDDTRQMFDFHAKGEYLDEVHFSDQDQAHHAHGTSRRAFGHAADSDVNA
jgi:hypothetical protein